MRIEERPSRFRNGRWHNARIELRRVRWHPARRRSQAVYVGSWRAAVPEPPEKVLKLLDAGERQELAEWLARRSERMAVQERSRTIEAGVKRLSGALHATAELSKRDARRLWTQIGALERELVRLGRPRPPAPARKKPAAGKGNSARGTQRPKAGRPTSSPARRRRSAPER